MKFIKRSAAAVLAILLAAPIKPNMMSYAASARAAVRQESAWKQPGDIYEASVAKKDSLGTASNAKKNMDNRVRVNTGNYEFQVVSRETFDTGEGDAFFEEDGSYTINIPESNPFFPYEVQFTGENGTDSQWFMTPDDSVEVDGHTFYVSAYFDNTVVTRMSLNVAGDPVIVYPEKKEFTNGDGAEAMSLLPLEERRLTADLTGYTPVELTMVKVDSIFTGKNELSATDKIVWKSRFSDDSYTISSPEDTIDLGSSSYTSYEMIVGIDNQLAADNIRYFVEIQRTDSKEWLIPSVFRQNSDGNRTRITVLQGEYRWYSDGDSYLRISVPRAEIDNIEEAYIGLKINEDIFRNPKYDHFKVYSGKHTVPEKAEKEGTEITAKLFAETMEQKDSGIPYRDRLSDGTLWCTMVSYDSSGSPTGCLPIELRLRRLKNGMVYYPLYEKTENGNHVVESSSRRKNEDGVTITTVKLYAGCPVDGKYFQKFNYSILDKISAESVTAAYVGQYESIKEASEAGAMNIRDSLIDPGDGYEADYSQGVYFTIFIGEDDSENQEIYKWCIRTEGGGPVEPDLEEILSDSTEVRFLGLNGAEDQYIYSYCVDATEDSYGDYTYRTILVDGDTDLRNLAPVFYIPKEEINLYTEGSNAPEISGESYHDFSKGPVHYTASAENKKAQRNYWLQVIKPTEGAGKLYINSLSDQDAKTQTGQDGVVRSTREMLLDGRYDYRHDILLINTGTEGLENLTAEIQSEEVELDEYWTLKGGYSLDGFSTVKEDLSNLAKIRVLPKEGMDDGRSLSGTLTIKSGDKVLMVLTLTGTVGDPSITTTEIPDAVKYVPYGTMIQNSNKYEWNEVNYELYDGDLPEGMELKPNGELYGVPKETGDFTFTVRMANSYKKFSDSMRTFTLTVVENTNDNVDAATDQGYTLTQRVQNITLNSYRDQLMVSDGLYGEFVDLYLDGVKLTRGVDYLAESGSTRLTIRGETLGSSNTPGTHTLGAEFRTTDTDTLKRAAQNYEIVDEKNSGNGNDSSGNGDSSGGKNQTTQTTPTPETAGDIRKGHVDSVMGIMTGEGTGYAHWVKDEYGWKLIYADGTAAAGRMIQLENGETVEQVLWELVDGSWYAFGANEYLKSGWVFDYQLNGWYLTSAESGMQSGWRVDSQDGQTYYMDPSTGRLAISWMLIDNNWYYFQALAQEPTWELNKENGNWFYNAKSGVRPYGAMYRDERTPDGYYVNVDGVWTSEER